MLRASLLVLALLAPPVLAAAPQVLPESNVERLERRLLDAPLGNHYSLYRIRSFVGGAEPLEQRWQKRLAEADQEHKERWALLLAMNAAPRHHERDLAKAKQWLKQAGDSFEAHSYRAAVASMEDDPATTAKHLQAAFGLRPEIAVLAQLHTVAERVAGDKYSINDALRFWHEAWMKPGTSPELRLAISDHLSILKEQTGERAAWLAELENRYNQQAGQGTGWAEAFALSRIHLDGRRADKAWEWLENGKKAGAPARAYHSEWSTLLKATEGREPAGFSVAKLNRMQVPARSADEMIGLFSDPPVLLARDVHETAAHYLKKNTKVALAEPLAWLHLRLDPQRQLTPALKDALFPILGAHVAGHPEDLTARYLLGHLLESSDRAAESAAVLDAFIQDAIPHVNQPVEGPDFTIRRTATYPFQLAFPSPNDAKPENEQSAGPSLFSLRATGPAEERTAYPIAPYLNLETHIETMGDLVLKALMILHRTDRARFEQRYRQWIEEAQPPLIVQFQLASKIDMIENSRPPANGKLLLADKVFAQGFEQKRIGAKEARYILQEWKFRLFPAKRVKQLGELILAEHPEQALAIKARYLRALLFEKRTDEAGVLLRELEEHARPGNPQDADRLRFLSGQLAKARGKPAPKTPAAERAKDERKRADAQFAAWVNYFKTGSPVSGVGRRAPYLPGRPDDWPFRLLVAQGHLLPGKPIEVMYHWGMYPVDASMTIYDTGYSGTNMLGDLKTTTRDQFRKLAAAVGEDNLRLELVRAYYDGHPSPEEQLAAVEDLSQRHPKDDRMRAVVAGKTLSLGRYKQAYEVASAISVEHGDLAWFANAVKLICATEMKNNLEAAASARALMPLTFHPDQREWLAGKLDELGLPEEAKKMRAIPAYLNKP